MTIAPPERADDAEWTAEDSARAVPFAALPVSLQRKLGRGPQKHPPKERVTIRLSRDVVESFRTTGPGWQTRLNAALQDWLKSHPPA